MGVAVVPVDLTNPGQVFACLGFVEAAEALLGDAVGGFDWGEPEPVRFRLSSSGDEDPVARVLRFLVEATVTSLAPPGSKNDTRKWDVDTIVGGSSSRAFPFPDPESPAKLPARLQDGDGHAIVIDHWGDATRRDNVKFWAGSGGYPGAALARDALELVRGRLVDEVDDPFAVDALQSGSFRFDWRRDYVPLDAGFSPNVHGDVVMRGYPVVELLAAIGLTHARPVRHNKLSYSYGVAGVSAGADLYDPIFLRAALGARQPPFPGMPFRRFRMQLDWPGQENQARCITSVIEERLQT